MDRYDTHICLVSEQTLPNLLPLLFEPFRPRQVVLMVTPKMKQQADRLERCARDLGVTARRVQVEAYSFEAMRQCVLDQAASLEGTGAINITGGTKVMALGAFDIAREFGLPAFYLDSRDQRILLLQPDGSSVPLPELLKVKGALAANGYTIDRGDRDLRVPPVHRELVQTLVSKASFWQSALSTLNRAAQKAEGKITWPVDLGCRVDDALAQLLDTFGRAGLLCWDRDRNQVVFNSEQARGYVNGGWLEEYCKHVAAGLKKERKLFDLMANVHIRDAARVRNELDLVFTARNRLHLIECKTAKLARQEGEATKGAQASYKLDTLRDVTGGSFARAMLVSFQRLSDMDLLRCEQYGIRVLQVRQLERLRDELLQWIAS